jgi:hypothetical protein
MHFFRGLERDRTFKQPLVWMTALVFVAFHAGAVAALFFFN